MKRLLDPDTLRALCDPIWRTERGIAVAGPRAFGYEFDYLPVEELAHASA